MNIKIDNFKSCIAALDFIDQLKERNKKCYGKLNSTLKQIQVLDGKTGKKDEEFEVMFHVTYDADLVKGKTDKTSLK